MSRLIRRIPAATTDLPFLLVRVNFGIIRFVAEPRTNDVGIDGNDARSTYPSRSCVLIVDESAVEGRKPLCEDVN